MDGSVELQNDALSLANQPVSAPVPPIATASPLVAASTFVSRVSITKDVLAVVQSIFAILAIIAGGIWFYLQRPYVPSIKTTTAITAVRIGDVYKVDAVVTFENSGHVPFSFDCTRTMFVTDPSQIPTPGKDCSAHIQLEPGQQTSAAIIDTIPVNEDKTYFVSAVAGRAITEDKWADTEIDSQRAILVQPAGSSVAEPVKSDPPPSK